MNSIRNEVKTWANSGDEELHLGTLAYRVMTMVAYLGDNGKEIHEANDLGTAYAIGYSLGHLSIKKNDPAVSYIVGAYNALKDYFKDNEPQLTTTAEVNNGSTN